jgi:hypothetical protein
MVRAPGLYQVAELWRQRQAELGQPAARHVGAGDGNHQPRGADVIEVVDKRASAVDDPPGDGEHRAVDIHVAGAVELIVPALCSIAHGERHAAHVAKEVAVDVVRGAVGGGGLHDEIRDGVEVGRGVGEGVAVGAAVGEPAGELVEIGGTDEAIGEGQWRERRRT